MDNAAQKKWESYRDEEFARAREVLGRRGFSLDAKQPHTEGERYLAFSGEKLVLLGADVKRTRCVIKVSSRPAGMKEIRHEYACRAVLHDLDFAYRPFFSPEEIAYFDDGGLRVLATKFIEEEKGFLEYSLPEQFFLALGAFKTQEGVQATTYRHAQTIKDIFGIASANSYLKEFAAYRTTVARAGIPETDAALAAAQSFLTERKENIERYAGFLTHTDFVPHNLRIADEHLYLLDHTSLRFGNKYESWGRFVNYMTLYHPALESALVDYVRTNRSVEEYEALRLMRAYKLGFLIAFYASNLAKTSGDLHELSIRRVRFWTQALEAVLADEALSLNVIDAYKKERDALRSEEEKSRQRLLNQL